jgi:hypothetical protein
MTPAPNRRWFRFSLRTLFVVVTILGCWLAYEFNWIRQRRAVVAESPKWLAYEGEDIGPMAQPLAPGLLWLLGEKGYAGVNMVVIVDELDDTLVDSWPPDDIKSELQRVEKLFPEAMVGAAPVERSAAGPELEQAISPNRSQP